MEETIKKLQEFGLTENESKIYVFLLETGDGYWRILKLPKPSFSGVYTIGVWGNSKNYKDIIYRDVVIN